MDMGINSQRRVVTLLRWVMFLALAYLTTSGGASTVQFGLLAVVAASNVVLARLSDRLWEHPALLPVVAVLDTAVLVGAMLLGHGFARDFFFAYFALLAVVALVGNLRFAVIGTALVVGSYGSLLALQHGPGFLQDPGLIGRLGFLFTVGVGYGGLLDASRSRMREAALQGQLVGWVSKLSAAFSDDFDAIEVIRQVLVDTQNAYPGSTRASLVQIEKGVVRVISSSDDESDGEFELTAERYPELIAATATGSPIVIDDIRTDPLTENVREFVEDAPFTSLLLCPVQLEDSGYGSVILRVARRGGQSFSPSIVATSQHVAQAIGVIFRQAKMREAMERSERMGMVSQVTSSVAHSFNDILSTVLVANQALRRAAEHHDRTAHCGMQAHGPDARDRFDAIDLASKEGLTIVERLGAWTRLGNGPEAGPRVAALPARDLLETAWRYASPVWAKRSQTRSLELRLDCESDVPSIVGAEAELREVLLNLILNAIDAMPKGGVLTLGLRADGDDVVYTVADTGTGIPEDVADRIFEPLFSTKGSAGTGLGLSLARSVVERHGGGISVDSTEGEGSRFMVRLPQAGEAAQVPESEQADTDMGSPRGARVLLVDPSDLVRDVMVRALQNAGYGVDVVADLDEAATMLEARSRYEGLLADAASTARRAEHFLRHLDERLARRVVLYGTGDLPAALVELQSRYGFEYFDRAAGLAALRKALASFGHERDAA